MILLTIINFKFLSILLSVILVEVTYILCFDEELLN
jgi:hypothetical protein